MSLKQVPILLYHKMQAVSAEEDPFRLGISPQQFERQMTYLYESGYRCLSLEDLAKRRVEANKVSSIRPSDGQGISKRAFIITFDDGYEDNFTVAYPILRRYGFTATIFVITDFIGRSLCWPGEQASRFLNWAQIEEMGRNGISFGSHTDTHPRLTKISDQQAAQEICHSKEILEERLGHKVSFFAYPGGLQTGRLQHIIRECGYQGACGIDVGPSTLFNLWRVQVHTDDSLALFRLKASGWFEWLKRLRQRSKALWWLTDMGGRSLNRARG